MVEEGQVARPLAVPAGKGANWLIHSFRYFQRDWLAWIGVGIIYVVVTLALALLPIPFSFVMTIFVPVFIAGLILGCQAQDVGGEFSVSYLFAGFSEKFGKLCIVGVAYALCSLAIGVVVGIAAILIFGGPELFARLETGDLDVLMGNAINVLLVMLIGLGLFIPVLMALWFAPALIILGNQPAFAAMKLSFMACLKNILPFFIYGLVGLVFSIIATIPLALGWLILGPMFVASVYLAYKDVYAFD